MRTAAQLLCATACLVASASAFASPRAKPFVIDSMEPSAMSVSPAPSVPAREATITDSDAGDDGGGTAGDDGGGTAGDAGDASAFPGRIPYLGGPIVSQARVAVVFWGPNVDPIVVNNIGGFYSALVNGAFMHFVSEYKTPTQDLGSYGTMLGTFPIQPVNTNTAITDADIQTELAQQISTGALPSPDSNTIYMIHFPPGLTIQGPQNIGVSCVNYCGYHFYGNGIIYAVLPDQSGGCAPGPFGCESNTTSTCCGDRTAFEDLTKSASHELMESITDPQPLAPAWTDELGGFGEIGDICNFSKQGDNAFASLIGENGRTYQAQRGFSDSAFVAGIGSPRGCVTYPTTLCCETPTPSGGSLPPPAPCSWLPNGLASCAGATSDLMISVPSIGGFGSGTLNLLGSNPFSGVCFPFGQRSEFPQYCATIDAPGLVEQPKATVVMPVDSTHPSAEACYGPPPPTGCPPGTSRSSIGCCGPLVPFVASGTTQSLETPVPGVATIPALPSRKGALFGVLLLALGWLHGRKARASARQDPRELDRA